MTVVMLAAAEADLDEAFHFYESCREGLGVELVGQFHAAVDRMLFYPRGWRALDETYRQCQLHQFPYGVVYEIRGEVLVIVAVANLSREQYWRTRRPS
jgi:catechol 2,3-dioxygenase-like lactoylglutathione lyase family enzyme